MRKYNVLLLSAVTLGSFAFVLTSCKDDAPSPPPQLSFGVKEMTVKESDANFNVEVKLDKAAPEDVEITYSIKGTARESVQAATDKKPADYKIVSDYLKVTINKGETTGIIEIDPYSDSDLELDDETIELAIEDTDSDQIEITRDDDITITLKQEDGLLVFLSWGEENKDYPDVDMDLFLWIENNSSQLEVSSYRGVSDASYSNWIGGNYPEFFFLPTAVADDGSYGISCTYYEGTVEPMKFEVDFIKVINGAEAGTVAKMGTYALVNINKWDDPDVGTDHQLVATFNKAGADFKDFSDLTIPTTGSRTGGSRNPELKRGSSLSTDINPVLKLFKK